MLLDNDIQDHPVFCLADEVTKGNKPLEVLAANILEEVLTLVSNCDLEEPLMETSSISQSLSISEAIAESKEEGVIVKKPRLEFEENEKKTSVVLLTFHSCADLYRKLQNVTSKIGPGNEDDVTGEFKVLPTELVLKILELLSSKDLVSMEMTSSHFRGVILGGEVWRKRAEEAARLKMEKVRLIIRQDKEYIKLDKVVNIKGERSRLDINQAIKKYIEDNLADKMWKNILKLA